MAYMQDNRQIALTTPLGKDVLLLQGFSGREAMSRLFSFDLELLSEADAPIEFVSIIGKNVTISVKRSGGVRHINGIVRRFSQRAGSASFRHYRAEVVPWLWLLTRTADCRIFPNMTVPDIITKIFTDLGFTDFRFSLIRSFQPREYCVQYRETDFNFVSRLMEQYGIFYFFEHAMGKHTLVMADAPDAEPDCTPGAVAYHSLTGAVTPEDVVSELAKEQEIRPAKYALTDYNFTTPSVRLGVSVDSVYPATPGLALEVYDYPGEYQKLDEGEWLAKVRIEEEEAQRVVLSGVSSCRQFTAGHKFQLREHPVADLDATYVLESVTHLAAEHGYESGGSQNDSSYSNRFTCIPANVPFRPTRVTPRPIIQGSQTAEVVGPKGEEIWTDKYGRVRVQFHWDREGNRDENSSCWIRVSHPWAGKHWGSIFIPRIGQEVVVDFLEGDPDQPLIIGRVYNGELMPPYELPANQTQSGVKSRSTPGGDAATFNELRFEDKKGQENVYLHAERTLTTVVEAGESRSVGGNRSTTIEKDDVLVVKKGNQHTTLEEGNRTSTMTKGNDTLDIVQGGRTITMKGDDKLTVQSGNREAVIVSGNDTLTVPAGNISITASSGKYSLVGNQVTITGLTEVNLLCGASVIKMTPAMITITAPVVKINC